MFSGLTIDEIQKLLALFDPIDPDDHNSELRAKLRIMLDAARQRTDEKAKPQ